MKRQEIEKLLQVKEDWCVSIILPTHRTSPDRRVDPLKLKKIINLAQLALQKKQLPERLYSQMTTAMDNCVHQIDPIHLQDGIGIFVSPTLAQLVYFPFSVIEKVVVDHTFETRDLYYLKQITRPYYVLNLTKDEVKLYQVEAASSIQEITNEHFPARYEAEYEYSKPSLGTSYGYAQKSFEKEKTSQAKIRLKSFFQSVHQHLTPLVKDEYVLLAGIKKLVTDFESSGRERLKIKGKVIGNFKNQNDLLRQAHLIYIETRSHEIQLLVDQLEELQGKRKVASGIRDVWTATLSGKGGMLLVEKDYRKLGYVLENGQHISLKVPKAKHTTIPDLVDQIIETAIAKGGEVVFTEEDQLKKFDHIALILRY